MGPTYLLMKNFIGIILEFEQLRNIDFCSSPLRGGGGAGGGRGGAGGGRGGPGRISLDKFGQKNHISFYSTFCFGASKQSYLLKSVLHRAAFLHCLGRLAAVSSNGVFLGTFWYFQVLF